jgi:choice-of-anchor A domain-containing protein
MKNCTSRKPTGSLKLLSAVVFTLLTNSAQASTSLLDLGTAGSFNAFVLRDMTAYNSDVEGRLAVGGNLTLNNYSIGMELSDSNGTRDDLIVGGTINYSNGRIYNGNARSGGTANIAQSVGFYNESNINSPNGSYIPGNPLDFSSISNDLLDKSNTWKNLTSTGTILTTVNDIRLTGTDSGLNVFNVSGNLLSSASSLWLDIPEDSWALVNISGTTINMHDFAFFRTEDNNPDVRVQVPDNNPGVFRHDGSMTQKVLLNLFDATELNLYAIGVKGSILAPNANTNFYNGQIDGNLIVGSLANLQSQQGGQINNYPVTTAPVPLPSMFIPVLTILAGFMRQQLFGRQKRV